jgi:hypothetical protein
MGEIVESNREAEDAAATNVVDNVEDMLDNCILEVKLLICESVDVEIVLDIIVASWIA